MPGKGPDIFHRLKEYNHFTLLCLFNNETLIQEENNIRTTPDFLKTKKKTTDTVSKKLGWTTENNLDKNPPDKTETKIHPSQE